MPPDSQKKFTWTIQVNAETHKAIEAMVAGLHCTGGEAIEGFFRNASVLLAGARAAQKLLERVT